MSYALASPHFELIDLRPGVGGLVAALAEKDAQIEASEWEAPGQASQSSVPSVLRPARDWTTAASPGSLKTAVP